MKLLSPSVFTKHPTSEESLHPKSFQSWRWVFLAAILLTAVTISTFYFSSAQAQANKGAITGLTLTSDAPRDPDGVLGHSQPHAHRLPR